MGNQPKRLSMTEQELLDYASRGYLQDNQVVISTVTKKKYRIIANNTMPSSLDELFSNRPKFTLKEI